MGAPRSYRLTASVAVLVGVLAFGTAVQAQNKCATGKLKCVAKKKACLLKVEGKALQKGLPVDGAKRQKCLDKFDGGLDPSRGCVVKLENKQDPAKPETLCTVTGDTASLEATVDAFVDDILTDLVLDYPVVEPPNKCHAALAKCVTKKCKCILKVRGKAIKKGEPIDPVKLQKCFDKFVDPVLMKGCVDKVYAKQDPAKPETLCDVPDDGASLEGKVDAFVDDIVGAVLATATPTPTPTATPTPDPNCGNGILDVGEQCDPALAGSPQCPNAGNGLQDCNPVTCRCDCPRRATFEPDPNDPGSSIDAGFTGFAHGMKTVGQAMVTVSLSGGTSGTPGQRDPDCGIMTVGGPIPNPAAGAGQIDNRRCSVDHSIRCDVDSECPAVPRRCSVTATPCAVDSDCPPGRTCGPQTCMTYFGSRLPLSAGGVSSCIINRFVAPIVGTANVETGDSANTIAITSELVLGLSADKPCDNCIADLVANDGSADGTCDTGDRAGLACDVNGTSPVPAFNGGPPAPGTVNGTSLDCPTLPLGSSVGVLPIDLSNSTGPEGLTVQATGPPCTAAGFGGSTCMCDTCATLAAEPCNKDADCLPFGGSICGGLRCLVGGAAGAACTIPGIGDPICLGAPCSTLGEPTKPNTCTTTVCTVGACASGPFNGFCGPVETFRGCLLASDCPFPGDTCGFIAQPCFDDDGIIGGTISATGAADVPVNDTARATVASVFCIAPVASPAVNAASGFPGAARVTLTGDAFGLP